MQESTKLQVAYFVGNVSLPIQKVYIKKVTPQTVILENGEEQSRRFYVLDWEKARVRAIKRAKLNLTKYKTLYESAKELVDELSSLEEGECYNQIV